MEFIPCTGGWTASFEDGQRRVMAWAFGSSGGGLPIGEPMVLDRGRLILASALGPHTLSEDASEDKVSTNGLAQQTAK